MPIKLKSIILNTLKKGNKTHTKVQLTEHA